MRWRGIGWIAAGVLCVSTAAAGTVDLTEQVRLLDASGAPIHGPAQVAVSIVGDADPALPETVCHAADLGTVPFADGYAALAIPGVNAACFNGPAWVAIRVDGSELGPRRPVTDVPRAAVARRVPTAASPTACDAAGELVYDTDAAALLVCDGAAWERTGHGLHSTTVDDLAPGAVATLAHGAGTNTLLAQAWIRTNTDPIWRPAGSGAAAPPEAGTGVDGVFLASTDRTLAGGEYNFTSFTIPAGRTVTVTGSAPLVIKSQGTASIAGTLLLAGGQGGNNSSPCCVLSPGGAAGGGGGYAGGVGSRNVEQGTSGSGPGGGGVGGMANQGGAGGGGGHGAAGSNGQVGTTASCGVTAGALGSGGAAYASLNNGVLLGGSGGGGGGSGGHNDASGAGGGGGGGAVKIVAPLVDVTGAINADGGKGGSVVWGPSGSAGAGGGGGAGGAIWIVASTARISGSATARGGAGGDPYTTPCYGGRGGAGAAGRIRVDAPAIETPGTVSPTPFSGDPGLPAVGAASLFQPDDDTVAVRNDGAAPIDVRILAIVP